MERTMTFLNAIYDNRKSFYNKAIVTENCVIWADGQTVKADGEKHLYSYGTEVCYIDNKNKIHLLPKWNFSQTTLRHIKEFLKQNGFKAESKAQIERDY